MAKTKIRLLLASAIFIGVGASAGLGAIAYSVYHDAGRSPDTSDNTGTLVTTTPLASTTGYLASAPSAPDNLNSWVDNLNSWVIFLDTVGGTVDAASYSGVTEKVSVMHGVINFNGKTIAFQGVDFNDIWAGFKSCPCRVLIDGSNLNIMFPTDIGLKMLTFYPADVGIYNDFISDFNTFAEQVSERPPPGMDYQEATSAQLATSCAQLKGTWYPNSRSDDRHCSVTYNNKIYNVSFDDFGNVMPSVGEDSRLCADFHNRWHADTDICEVVAP